MCTSISYRTKEHYFGRNLDWHFSYGEQFVITPRNFLLDFRHEKTNESHYAIYGTAIIENEFPLYFEAVNETGLCVASLNFPENAKYCSLKANMKNITSFEFIPWLLSCCKNINEVVEILKDTNITNDSFSDRYPPSPLHWIVADNDISITIEALSTGIKIYDNPYGVLTNNPTFDIQVFNLNNYIGLSTKNHKGNFADKISLSHYSNGMGMIGLPGDLSSASRFVRAVFTKVNSVSDNSEEATVNQFFHILDSVSQKKGCNKVSDNEYEYTVYSSCYNANKNMYYYKTYEDQQIKLIDVNKEDLAGTRLISFDLIRTTKINIQN